MKKATLAKRDIEFLGNISDPTSQNQARKTILSKKQANMDKSTKAFKEYLGRRKARINAEVSVEVRESKRGSKFIVVNGGGLLNSVWLSVQAATTLSEVIGQIEGLIPEIVSEKDKH